MERVGWSLEGGGTPRLMKLCFGGAAPPGTDCTDAVNNFTAYGCGRERGAAGPYTAQHVRFPAPTILPSPDADMHSCLRFHPPPTSLPLHRDTFCTELCAVYGWAAR